MQALVSGSLPANDRQATYMRFMTVQVSMVMIAQEQQAQREEAHLLNKGKCP